MRGSIRRGRRMWLLCLQVMGVMAIAAIVAACGGSSSSPTLASDNGKGGGLTKMNVSYLPAVQFAPLFLARSLGYFKDAGLDVKLAEITNGTTLVPALLKGQYQGSVTSWGAIGLANAAGLPLVGTNTFDVAATDSKKDPVQLVVKKSSPITSLEQLQGKTIAVTATKNASEVSLADWLKKSDVTAKYVALSLTSMGAALKAGTVDAVSLTEPSLTQLEMQTPVRELGGPDTGFIPGMPITAFMMTKSFVAKNSSTATAFMKALDKATAYAAAHPAAVRKVFPDLAGVSAAVAARSKLPQYSTTIDVAKLNEQMKAFVNYGIAEKSVDMGTTVADIAKSKVVGQH